SWRRPRAGRNEGGMRRLHFSGSARLAIGLVAAALLAFGLQALQHRSGRRRAPVPTHSASLPPGPAKLARLPAEVTWEVAAQTAGRANEPISLDVRDADVRDLLNALASNHGLNIVYGPKTDASISIHLEKVSLEAALDAIVRAAGLSIARRDGILYVQQPA